MDRLDNDGLEKLRCNHQGVTMYNDNVPSWERVKLPVKWEIKLFLVFIFFALVCALFSGPANSIELGSPVCPTGTPWIAQRYDTWRYIDGRTQIVHSVWIRKCLVRK